jgi:tRNA modification GTPase
MMEPQSRGDWEPNRASLRLLYEPLTGELIDEALVTWFRAPHSFTGEEVVEISCHGSPVVLEQVLRLALALGAELAQPGEFTLRAFLNRRLDLTQAEAIHDLIQSQTSHQARVAARQLRGELSRQLQPLRAQLIELIVHLESSVEFVEDDLDPLDLARFHDLLREQIASLARLTATYRSGRVLRQGARMALIGLPNVGKSSLFNALLGQDRAIVTSLPGTTRDLLQEPLSIGGIPVQLVDTAGIRQTEDPIEQIGVERTHSAIVEADFVVAVIEATSTLPEEEVALLREASPALYLINKSDLGSFCSYDRLAPLAGERPILEVSAQTGQGMEALRQALQAILLPDGAIETENSLVTNERHYRALLETLTCLEQACQVLEAGLTEEILLDPLHLALRNLGLITGETLIDDLLNQIFATFCIGK